MPFSSGRLLRTAILLPIFAAVVSANVVLTPPAGLAVGDQYRLIFLTDLGMAATSGDISTYDTYVTNKANAPLSIINANNLLSILGVGGVTWQAVASTAAVDARDHIGGVFNTPVYRLNGVRLANDSADLWDGSLLSPVRNDDLGHDHNYPIWTGSNSNGTASSNPLGSATATFGYSDYTNAQWIDFGSVIPSVGTAPNTDLRSIYGISSLLTLVPEPRTWTMLVAGAFLLCATRARARLTGVNG